MTLLRRRVSGRCVLPDPLINWNAGEAAAQELVSGPSPDPSSRRFATGRSRAASPAHTRTWARSSRSQPTASRALTSQSRQRRVTRTISTRCPQAAQYHRLGGFGFTVRSTSLAGRQSCPRLCGEEALSAKRAAHHPDRRLQSAGACHGRFRKKPCHPGAASIRPGRGRFSDPLSACVNALASVSG